MKLLGKYLAAEQIWVGMKVGERTGMLYEGESTKEN